jgi:uncharacterized protein
MSANVSYPGVYIVEIPSSVHTITGVATSITAFVGWAPQGTINSPQLVPELILSWSDYVREYGGLDTRSLMSYAVSQFFSNGGSQAYIIRLVSADAAAASLTLNGAGGSIVVTAASPGVWANNYGIIIKNQAGNPGRFGLQVAKNPPGASSPAVVESFQNLSITTPDPQGRYFGDIFSAHSSQSNFITASATGTLTAPPPDTAANTAQNLTGGADGTVLTPSTNAGTGGAFETALFPASGSGGVNLLDLVPLFNLLCVPGEIVGSTLGLLEAYCEKRRAFLIADADPGITDPLKLQGGPPINGMNAAYYFPWIEAPDPLRQGGIGPWPPCGFMAGIYAATDASRGVWKAPAGTAATLIGVNGPHVPLNDAQNGVLNPVAVNCIRTFQTYGTVVWGARTTQGSDEAGSQWKYVPVRRIALFIEESLYEGTKWAVFEPNDEPLWASLRLNIGAFMQDLFRKGAFQGQTPQDAYFVKCDDETTTQNDINLGIVNVLVGFAPLKPAEFVVLQIQQIAGQIAT